MMKQPFRYSVMWQAPNMNAPPMDLNLRFEDRDSADRAAATLNRETRDVAGRYFALAVD